MVIIPPYLKKGDSIGITCPAGIMPFQKMQTCIQTLQDWGFTVKTGETVRSKSLNYFSGTDDERLHDLQMMLDDQSVKAILFGRGGYGTSRIVDDIDFKIFKKSPKWLLGYSDITVLHAHLFSVIRTASMHCNMAAAFNDGGKDTAAVQAIRLALQGKAAKYSTLPGTFCREGKATGELVGGNLSLLVHLTGTRSAYSYKNKILFIEDVGEYLYGIDRMMVHMERTGVLKQLAGLIVGQFSELKDTLVPFGQEVHALIWDKIKKYRYPVCFDFPVGHVSENYPLKVGVQHTLHVTKKQVSLREQTI